MGREIELLKGAVYFGSVPLTTLRALRLAARRAKYDAGETLLRAGAPVERMMLLVNGRIRGTLGSRLSAGALIGPGEVIAGAEASETLICESAVGALVWPRQVAVRFLEAEPTIAAGFAQAAADRLAEAMLFRVDIAGG